MRLCFIANGQSIHTRRWLEPLIAQGDEIHLFSYTPLSEKLEGVITYDLTRLSQQAKLRFLYWGWWLRRKLKDIRPDIVHCHQLQPAGWLGVLAGYHPLIVTGWGSDVLVEPYRSKWRRYLLKIVLQQADCVTVPSNTMLEMLSLLGTPPDKLHLIPWGINSEIFSPEPDDRIKTRERLGLPTQAFIVLSPRSLAAIYNHDVILHAFSQVVEVLPSAHLLFIKFNVNEDYEKELAKLIAEYSLQEKVIWLPAQSDEENLASLYRAVDVIVSIPTTEGYGATVYEAMSCGCPTLLSDLPLFADELIHNYHTFKVPVRDVASTAQGIIHLLMNPTIRENLVQNAYSVCVYHSLNHRIALTTSLYQEFAHA